MHLRKIVIDAGLLEYEKKGAKPDAVELMRKLFEYHLTESYKHCILGTPFPKAHAAVCTACRKLPAPEPDLLTDVTT